MDERNAPEVWADIPRWPGYQASSWGRIRSVDRLVTCTNGVVRRYRGQMLRINPMGNGRPGVMMCSGALRSHTKEQVGVLVLEAFVGPRPSSELYCCHDNDDPWDNVPSNLRWDTSASNSDDRVRHGMDHHAVRERCPRRHPLEPPNLVESQLRLNGTRACKACAQARCKLFYEVKRGRPAPDLQTVSDQKYAAIMARAATM